MDDELVKELIEALQRYQGVKNLHVAGGRQAVVRCFQCGDSKNRNHAHLYIKLASPSYFNCKICNYSGIVGRDFLTKLGLYEPDLSVKLDLFNKKQGKNKRLKDVTKDKGYRLSSLIVNEDKDKIEYLEDRLNFKITSESLLKYKIILSLDEFLVNNEINTYSRNNEELDILNQSYVGFLSTKGDMITFRNITNENLLGRYVDYSVIPYAKNLSRVYTIANNLDLLTPTISLHLAEGIISIINVERFLAIKKDQEKHVFCSCGGKNFKEIIDYFYELGFLDLNINIYSDSDVQLESYKKLLYSPNIKLFKPKITILWNKNQDDFGVKDIIPLPTRLL